MTEHVVETRPNVAELLARDEADFEYFSAEAGLEGLPTTPEYQSARLIDTLLWVGVDYPGVYKATDENHRRILEGLSRINFQKQLRDEGVKVTPFVPKRRSEAQTVVDIPLKRFKRAAGAHQSPEKAAQSAYLKMRGYFEDAEKDMHTLNEVMAPLESGGFTVDVRKFKADREVQELLTELFMKNEFLAKGEWPASNTKAFKERQKYWHGAVVAMARYASPSTITAMLDIWYERSRGRMRYWRFNGEIIDKTAGGAAVKAAIEAASDDVQESPESGEKVEVRIDKEEPSPRQENEGGFKIPDSVIPELAKNAVSLEPKAHAIETLVRQGWGQHAAELRVLGSRGVYHEGVLVGIEPKEERPHRGTSVRRRKPVYGARQREVADSDARVRTERELLGPDRQ